MNSIDILRAKEIATSEVLARVVTLEQAKVAYRKWIENGLSEGGGFTQDTIDFWEEVCRQIDEVSLDNKNLTT